MWHDTFAIFRKVRLIGVLTLLLVALTATTTTVHALQHVVSASAAAVNPGDTEACGLCQLDFVTYETPGPNITVSLTYVDAYICPYATVVTLPIEQRLTKSLRGPPVDA